MENALIAAEINRNGEVTSFVLKGSGREFAASPMNRFRMYKDVPRMFDAWDIDSNYVDQEVEAAADITTEIIEEGLEAVLRVKRKNRQLFLYPGYPAACGQQKAGIRNGDRLEGTAQASEDGISG